jgi:hypothetical protein
VTGLEPLDPTWGELVKSVMDATEVDVVVVVLLLPEVRKPASPVQPTVTMVITRKTSSFRCDDIISCFPECFFTIPLLADCYRIIYIFRHLAPIP